MKNYIVGLLLAGAVLHAQNPQTQTAPIVPENAKYVNGVAPGYYPMAGSGLTLNVGPGTANCAGTIITYAGGTLSLTASTTNYIYLNTASSCAPATKTSAFTSSDIPLAKVVTGSASISLITDDRTPFFEGTGSSGGTSTGDVPLSCIDTSGSVSGAYSCTTSPTFVPQIGNCLPFIPFHGVVGNSPTLTLNVNGSGIVPLAVPSYLSGNVPGGVYNPYYILPGSVQGGALLHVCYDGTNWDIQGGTSVTPGAFVEPYALSYLNLTQMAVGPGVVNCGGTFETYAGGILAVTTDATDYFYLDTAASCAPAVNTTGFPANSIPLQQWVFTGGGPDAHQDYRAAPTNAGFVSANGSPILSPNFNSTLPAAPGGNTNCTWQISGSNVSCYVPTSSGAATSVPVCSDVSGSATAQSCTTSPSFTPTTGSCIAYRTTTPNSGATLTLNVNTSSADTVAKWQGTTTLVAGDVASNKMVLACLDSSSHWELSTIGNAPGASGITQITGDITAGPGSGSQVATLPNVNSTSGTCGDAAHVCQVTTNAKGQTTAQSSVPITGNSGAWTNITSVVTVSGCTVSGGSCAVSGSSTTTVTFSSIPGTYNALQLMVWGETSSLAILQADFNGDSSANYVVQGYFSNGGTLAVNDNQNQGACDLGDITTSLTSQSIADILFYANTAFPKSLTAVGMAGASISSGSSNFQLTSGCVWNNTAVITSVSFITSAGHFVAGTQFEILAQQ